MQRIRVCCGPGWTPVTRSQIEEAGCVRGNLADVGQHLFSQNGQDVLERAWQIVCVSGGLKWRHSCIRRQKAVASVRQAVLAAG
jgi:hypothetical protein